MVEDIFGTRKKEWEGDSQKVLEDWIGQKFEKKNPNQYIRLFGVRLYAIGIRKIRISWTTIYYCKIIKDWFPIQMRSIGLAPPKNDAKKDEAKNDQ